MNQGIMGSAHEQSEAPGKEQMEERTGNEDPGEAPESGEQNEAYQAGMDIVMDALYGKGAAKDMAKTFGAGDPATAVADAAYKIIEVADERTQGQIPDELLVSFATDVLSEVCEVAEAAGVTIDGALVSKAFSAMLQRWLESQGMNSQQVAQAMQQMTSDPNTSKTLDQAATQEM